jgi:hypothetical protein
VRIFATLYFRDIEYETEHFKLLKKLGYMPEIYFESGYQRFSVKEHKELSRKIDSELGGCSIHLPYREILPGSGDPQATLSLLKASEIANIYNPIHMVGHPYFRPLKDSLRAPSKHIKMARHELKASISTPNENFLKNSLLAWGKVIEETSGQLFLENTIERSPYPIQLILEQLPKERSSMCLDVGHWHYAGMGSNFKNLPEWMEICSKRLGHLHLHDNDGTSDQHLSIGKGRIDFELLKSLLRQYGLNPSATIENQSAPELEDSAKYLSANPF